MLLGRCAACVLAVRYCAQMIFEKSGTAEVSSILCLSLEGTKVVEILEFLPAGYSAGTSQILPYWLESPSLGGRWAHLNGISENSGERHFNFQEKLCRNLIRHRMTQNSNRIHRIGPVGTLEVRNQPSTNQLGIRVLAPR
jgi:hypothetical protein